MRRIAMLLIVLPLIGSAQNRAVEIGMTRGHVLKMTGAPNGYFADGIRTKAFPRVTVGYVTEIYDRRVQGRKYELRIGYQPDESKSRLNPPLVVSELRFVSDKLMPASQLLTASIEAGRICARGCEILSRGDRGLLLRSNGKEKFFIEVSAMTQFGTGEEPAVRSLDDTAGEITISTIPPFSFEKLTKLGDWPRN
ncbi:hypothetical protein [Terriglobus sp. RCC_193]|uniref:hypothetical protein n=1 Tax=Terriglobus sp. RCC_193 TaxID=3239218 RepID=UPI003525B64B